MSDDDWYEHWLTTEPPDVIKIGDGKPGFTLDLSAQVAELYRLLGIMSEPDARLSASAGKDRR
jgi:hypothetical protein